MTLALRYLAHSEVGLVRKNNQDSAYASPTMLIVADGMGGAAAGDLASAIAVAQLVKADEAKATGEDMLTEMGAAITRASDLINDLVRTEPSLDGMGSTVCGLMFDGEHLALANVGDSRAYRYRDGVLTRLSKDHSWVQSLIDEGRITEAEALEHPHRSLILKVINGQPQHTPDLEMLDIQVGDRLLVCSDGLCGMVTDQVISARIDGERDDAMAALIRVAHLEGGQDNITIIIADVVEGEPEGEPQILGSAAQLDAEDLNNEATLIERVAPPKAAAPNPNAPEVARYAPTSKGRGLAWLKVTLAVLLPLLLIGAGGGLWYSYTQEQYFVGPNAETIGIYRGVPEPVFNLPLSHLVQADSTRIIDLPPYYQEQVRQTLPASSLDAARTTLVMLQTKAAECIKQRQQWHNPPSTTPTPNPSTAPSGTAKPTPGASSAVPVPTPSETPAGPTEC
ncbi:MAG: protein phosphatase 2C domain-containing protein [Propionibacteriales bacterium]|nr:protein phosphatase 2C domain-containing protein [Propionibacteriales bacterium]